MQYMGNIMEPQTRHSNKNCPGNSIDNQCCASVNEERISSTSCTDVNHTYNRIQYQYNYTSNSTRVL